MPADNKTKRMTQSKLSVPNVSWSFSPIMLKKMMITWVLSYCYHFSTERHQQLLSTLRSDDLASFKQLVTQRNQLTSPCVPYIEQSRIFGFIEAMLMVHLLYIMFILPLNVVKHPLFTTRIMLQIEKQKPHHLRMQFF